MSKITVDKFIQEFKVQKEDSKLSYVKRHIVTDYINYENKIATCAKIIDASCYQDIGGKHVVSFNSPMKYVLYIFNIITNYTDIEVSENWMDDFNKLTKNRCEVNDEEYTLIDMIVGNISPCEIQQFGDILDCMIEDLKLNEYTVVSKINSFGTTLEYISKYVEEDGEKDAKEVDRVG